MSKRVTEKVVAYITQVGAKGHAPLLLVFSHPFHPEAGIQVPAGTIKDGESPEVAVIREVREETGLSELKIRSFLGMREYDLSPYGRDEVQRRHFFHLEFHGETPAIWRHYENDPSEGGPGPIEFEFFWVRFPGEVPELAGGQGELLSKMGSSMTQIDLKDAQAHLLELVERAAGGEEIVITKDNQPLVKLVAVTREPAREQQRLNQGVHREGSPCHNSD
jgi:prevent-host-death family protein